MNFRETISNFYPLLHNKKNKIFMFFIGSYPHTPGYKHEVPKVLKDLSKLDISIHRLYIDGTYHKDDRNELNKRLGESANVFKCNITEYDYRIITEFCHIAGNIGNSLSIIFEFTGISRKEHFMEDNMQNYLYITPCDCMANTNNIEYNPILEFNDNKYGFFHPSKIEFLSNQIVEIFRKGIGDEKMDKLDILRFTLKTRLRDVGEIYRLLFNYMIRKDVFDVDYEITFNKEKPFFYSSIDLLVYRMGYNKEKTQCFIDEFFNSDEIDFENYVKQKIQNIFVDCLIMESNGDEIVTNQKYESIIFETPDEVYNIYQRFNNLFSDINVI
jgi:hypothetical protein